MIKSRKRKGSVKKAKSSFLSGCKKVRKVIRTVCVPKSKGKVKCQRKPIKVCMDSVKKKRNVSLSLRHRKSSMKRR